MHITITKEEREAMREAGMSNATIKRFLAGQIYNVMCALSEDYDVKF